MGNTLPKTERLYHKKTIDSLFKGGKSKSMTAFPLRLVYMPMEDGDRCEMLVSVPKRNLHRANKRNRVKRQVRRLTALTRTSWATSVLPWRLFGSTQNCGTAPTWNNEWRACSPG